MSNKHVSSLSLDVMLQRLRSCATSRLIHANCNLKQNAGTERGSMPPVVTKGFASQFKYLRPLWQHSESHRRQGLQFLFHRQIVAKDFPPCWVPAHGDLAKKSKNMH